MTPSMTPSPFMPRPRLIWICIAALMLQACACPPAPPVNLTETKARLFAYMDDGRYGAGLDNLAQAAKAQIEQDAAAVARGAIVLDIDETALSNGPAMRANDFAYFEDGPCAQLPKGPCGYRAWQSLAAAPAIAPIHDLYQWARARGIAVFFVTGRPESLRAATEKNLRLAGYDGWQALIMRPQDRLADPAAAIKAPARAQIEKDGYTILANIGDQPGDLAGGHALHGYLLPNPFYRIP